ncbi:DUF4375 domain-containing protein [Alteraurantiacibacter aquimixticola]|uniref:DUF4375 domain-containing protein n=2 Tax=Alteraurantiacibacter aquimixticola TaxID=2489173 RepID=A0A4T3EXE6_9SPHN|nr:DUF4375 domain-containing protein [Alteraurantiacibacter aquimixticola]
MEESREFYKKLKEYDPVRELWVSLVKRSSHDPSLRDWSRSEARYFAVGLLEGQIFNGGFDQYFSNSSGDYYEEAVCGLEEIGATDALALLHDAVRLIFGEHQPPKAQSERWDLMKRLQHTSINRNLEAIRSRALDELDRAFYEISTPLSDSLLNYAKAQGLIAPFEQES